MSIDKSLISGSTSMLVLSLLAEKERYGYEMIDMLESMSQNVFSFKAGTLYPLLHGLEGQGLVAAAEKLSPNGRIRKYYRITPKGRGTLADKRAEWDTFTLAVNRVLEGGASVAEVYGY